MKSKKNIIFANWKMNPSSVLEAKAIVSKTKKTALTLKRTEVVLCPPFPFLHLLKNGEKNISLGAQNVFWEPSGTFTGEVSPQILKESGVSYVIIGHSERRALGENDEIIAKKVCLSLSVGLKVVLCVGESERNSTGAYLNFLGTQLRNSLAGIKKKNLSEIIIAYEPVWAISKSEKAGEAMNPVEVHETVLFLKRVLIETFGRESAEGVKIIYGGSANFENAVSLMKESGISGLLVGRESLNTKDFPRLLSFVDGI